MLDYLLSALLQNNDLEELALGGNQIKTKGAMPLACAIYNNSSLKKLDICENRIGDEGVEFIAYALKSNHILEYLGLGSNGISNIGAACLAEALKANNTLNWLYLSSNLIEDDGIKSLAKALKQNNSLNKLIMAANSITDRGAKYLAQALIINKSLTTLFIDGNAISKDGLKEFAAALPYNYTLTDLDVLPTADSELYRQIKSSYEERNNRCLEELKSTACRQLSAARILLYKAKSADNEYNLLLALPVEIIEKIVTCLDNSALLTNEQQRKVLNYAEGNIESVADKNAFFKATKCEKVRKQLNLSNDEFARLRLV